MRRVVRRYLRQRAFQQDYSRFIKLAGATLPRFALAWSDRLPCLDDATGKTPFDRHYVYHPAWAARILAQTRPLEHIDISSILAFSTIVSAFLPTRFYDYRPAALALTNLESQAADLMALPFPDGNVRSLSCMHTVEHIGLGRYGDPLDYDGDLKAMGELQRVLAPGGDLLFVVPIGRPKIVFNAHRIYSYRQVIEAFSLLTLREFSLIPDRPEDGGLVPNATEQMADKQHYGCGCFWFRKDAA